VYFHVYSLLPFHFEFFPAQQQDFARARSAQIERNEFEERFPRLPLSAQRLYQGDPSPAYSA
jgi:hypothetical protein